MSWFDDTNDRELLDLIPFFEQLAKTDDIFSFILNASLPLGLAGGGGGGGGGATQNPPTAVTQYQQSETTGGGSYCINE